MPKIKLIKSRAPEKDLKANGFTIVELLLATAVFSLVLVGALAGFLRTGNVFYKGVSITQTQNVAKSVMDDVSGNLASTGGYSAPGLGGYSYYCIGNTRYTYVYNIPYLVGGVSDYSSTGNFGLIKNTVSGCPTPCNPASGSCTFALSSGTEMLGDNMRVSQFLICGAGGSTKLNNINLTISYGDDTTLSNISGGQPVCPVTPAYTPPNCTGNTENRQFCAVSSLSTSVYSGVSL